MGISKIVLWLKSLIITVPNSILEKIQTIQKTFLWYSSKPKIEDGGLKNVDVKSKTISL